VDLGWESAVVVRGVLVHHAVHGGGRKACAFLHLLAAQDGQCSFCLIGHGQSSVAIGMEP